MVGIFSIALPTSFITSANEATQLQLGALVEAVTAVVLLVGWMIGRVERGSEWPKSRLVLAKIGSLRAERWHREEKEMFLLKMIDDFHSAVSEEIGERVSRLAEAASPGPEQELDLTGGGC